MAGFNVTPNGRFCPTDDFKLCRGGDTVSSFAANGIRANSPYCMYRIEQARGEEPVDNDMTRMLLSRLEQQTAVTI